MNELGQLGAQGILNQSKKLVAIRVADTSAGKSDGDDATFRRDDLEPAAVRFDLGADLRHNGLSPGSLVLIIVLDVVGSIQAKQQGDMGIRQCLVQERPLVEEGAQALQCAAMEHVDGAQHRHQPFLHALVGMPSKHLNQVVELMQCRSNLRRRRIGSVGHGDSPLP